VGNPTLNPPQTKQAMPASRRGRLPGTNPNHNPHKIKQALPAMLV